MQQDHQTVIELVRDMRDCLVEIRSTRSIRVVAESAQRAAEMAREAIEILQQGSNNVREQKAQKVLFWLIERLHDIGPGKMTDEIKQQLFVVVQFYLLPIMRDEHPQTGSRIVRFGLWQAGVETDTVELNGVQ